MDDRESPPRPGLPLQRNTKQVEGTAHEDRDAQFRYLNDQSTEHIIAGQPVIIKKKELVGLYKNGGQQWRPAGDPVRVNVHDFADRELGKANPYGVYDVTADDGCVSVGTDHDTTAFAVETIRRWFAQVGHSTYPGADRLLTCADGGGSNGYRLRAWKTQLAALATETGLTITVCHLPPGTSKWNKIEHRLFSHISMNWRGRPLTSHQVIIELNRESGSASFVLPVDLAEVVSMSLATARPEICASWVPQVGVFGWRLPLVIAVTAFPRPPKVKVRLLSASPARVREAPDEGENQSQVNNEEHDPHDE